MSEGKQFNKGIPTGPEVDLLFKELGVPKPGLIEHSVFERLTNLNRRSSRYRTVIAAWKKRLMKQHNVDTEAVPGEGIVVLTEAQRVDVSARDFGRGSKKIVNALGRVSVVRRHKLDSVSLKKFDHMSRVGVTMMAAVTGGVTEITAGFKAIAQLPRVVPEPEK